MMRRPLAITLAITVGVLAAAAPAAAKDPVPAKGALTFGATPDFGGVSGPPATPSGDSRLATIFHDDETTVIRTETDGGELRATSPAIDGDWRVPAVTLGGEASGLSADGETLVLYKPEYTARPTNAGDTEFLVLDAQRLRVRDRVTIEGLVTFDAISPDGETMYLVRYDDPSRPLDYQVRAYDLAAGELVSGEIVDPSEPEEQMGGQPVDRAMSPDGRWAYTLYGGGEEAFIHAIDTEGRTAACIDLEDFSPDEAFRLNLDVAAGTGAITVSRRAQPLAEVDPDGFAVTPAEPASPAPAAPDDEGPGVGPFLVAVVAAAVAAIAWLAIRRRRRHRDETELGRVFAAAGEARADDAEADEEREREPEPVP